MKLNKITEARYAGKSFFVQLWCPENGDSGVYAGPFTNLKDAQTFAASMSKLVEENYGDVVDEMWFPNFPVEELVSGDEFAEEVKQFMDVMV